MKRFGSLNNICSLPHIIRAIPLVHRHTPPKATSSSYCVTEIAFVP